MSSIDVEGRVVLEAPGDAIILEAGVSLLDVSLLDGPADAVGAGSLEFDTGRLETLFLFQVDPAVLRPGGRYIVVAQADVRHGDASIWRYGVTVAYPWPAVPARPIILKRLHRVPRDYT